MTSSGPIMLGSYDYGIVILSVLISILAASAAVDLAGRVAATRGKAMLLWLLGGATASGIGTWSMHYTGMRAFSLPVPVQYAWPTVLLSLLPAVLGSAVAMFVVSRVKVGLLRLYVGGILVGGGIAALHYTAMASMRLPGMCHYSPLLVTLSVVLAILFSVIPLKLTFVVPAAKAERRRAKIASILLLGAANPVMHYTAMGGATFTRSPVVPDLAHAVSISTIGLRVFAIIPLMILTVALATSLADRLQKESALLDELFEQAPQAIVLTDPENRVLRVNSEFTRLFGYTAQETIGRPLDGLIVPEVSQDEFQKHTDLVVAFGKRVDSEGIRQRKDGSRLHASVIRVPVALPGGQSAIYAILSDISERKRVEEIQAAQTVQAQLRADVSTAFATETELGGILQRCTEAMVEHLDAAFARIWTLKKNANVLELRASAGMYTHLDGPHGRLLVGTLEIGHIAQEKKPRLTNEVVDDPLISDRAWAKREGIVALAGYPLIVEGRIVGVMAMFARRAITPATLDTLASVADTIAQGIERKQAEQELQHSFAHLRALAGRLQRVREEERTRVAREIHDELGQTLTAIKIDLSTLSYDMSAEKKHLSGSIMKLADETIQSVRRISTELRPAVLDTLGLVAAVEWAAEAFEARTGSTCRLEMPPDEVVIDDEAATALFRIFQETLTNVARHAAATEVNVRLAMEDDVLTLEVHDNGKGVNEEQLSAGSSLGILGMRERALLLGGDLTITGAPGEGTTVRVRIPKTLPAPPKDDN